MASSSMMMLALRNLSAMGLCRSGRWLAPSALKVTRQFSSGVPQTAVHGKRHPRTKNVL